MFIDSHCHLDFPCFSQQLPSLLCELHEKSINKVIIPATQANTWERVEKLALSNDALYYALGIHPHFLDAFEAQDLTVLKDKLLLRDKSCVALGEIGLDKFSPVSEILQEFVFIEQLKIAQQLQLPIILHCVKRQGRVLTLLKQYNFKQGGVYHAFSGSLEIADEFIKLGFKLGIGGVITYPNSSKVRDTVAKLPVQSMVLETDAPDMPIYEQPSKDNTPLNIITIFDCLVSLRSETKSQLATQLSINTHNIFSLCND